MGLTPSPTATLSGAFRCQPKPGHSSCETQKTGKVPPRPSVPHELEKPVSRNRMQSLDSRFRILVTLTSQVSCETEGCEPKEAMNSTMTHHTPRHFLVGPWVPSPLNCGISFLGAPELIIWLVPSLAFPHVPRGLGSLPRPSREQIREWPEFEVYSNPNRSPSPQC